MSQISLIELEIIEKIDKDKMLKAVEDFETQCEEALSIARSTVLNLKLPKIRSVLIAGMGDSGIGGDIIKSVLEDEVTFPIFVNKGYHLPKFVGESTLCFVVSYSGDTEETLSCFDQAASRGAPIIAVASGGNLAKKAHNYQLPLVKIPSGLQPRAALGYLALPILICLERLDLIRSKFQDITESIEIVKNKKEEWWRQIPLEENKAQMWAMKLTGKLPVIYGSEGATQVAALRWKCQFNETSKTPAFWNVLPELNHNETVGWELLEETTKKFSLILLRDRDESQRVKKRIKITRDLMEEQIGQVLEVWAEGNSKLAKILSLIYFGDFVTTYLAILSGVDPSPVEKVQILKKRLTQNTDNRG